MKTYNPWKIEAYWREQWAKDRITHTPTPKEGQPTYYCLDFFPYPSGAGLSVGHGRNYIPSDVIARYRRMQGDAVLHPMGWDAFGLPAENEAMKKGIHPAESTIKYAANYRQQLNLLGCSYDWEREINSANPAYYRWNQFFFLMLFKKGLAYRAEAPVNWCESCQTVLASEEIEDGNCWRCHNPVVRKRRQQWYIRVTAYADELYDDLERLDWPQHILTMQRHWIGRSEGVDITLPIAGDQKSITVFTTRPDTLFGATFVALAPEHPMAEEITTREHISAVQMYIQRAAQRSDLTRHTREPDGVRTGCYAILPNGEHVPVFIADYVMAEHGTGAIMGVPAHDIRDFAFAQKYRLPIKCVITSEAEKTTPIPYTEPGMMKNSGQFDGITSINAQSAIADWLEAQAIGHRAVHYRLRDWLVSRQRYWGTPIPIVHCPNCGEVPVPVETLPVMLPSVPDYQPRGDGKSPLANISDFVHTVCPQCQGPAERETDTMTGFVCSSWYYMRFIDPHNDTQPFDPTKAAQWLPVDVYVGGAEHAVGHLMYSRFWTKFLADAGMLRSTKRGGESFREPFPILRSQGVLHARDSETEQIERMSKSKGNTVTPESVIERYGADVTRLHLLFMGPFEANVVWEVEADGITPQHIEGVRRFLLRVWRLCTETNANQGTEDNGDTLQREKHRTIQEVNEQIEILHFNKAISALMAFANTLDTYRRQHGDSPSFIAVRKTLLKLLAPFAPFITEELWTHLGEPYSIHQQSWPEWDADLAAYDKVEIAVQVNGKVRDRIIVAGDAGMAQIREQALTTSNIQQALQGCSVDKVIVVPGRIVSIVAH